MRFVMFIKRKIVLILMSGFIFLAALLSCQLSGVGDTVVRAVEFITTWETTSDGESITIPTEGTSTYDYTVDWGDGNSDTGLTGNKAHTYATAGTYTIKISGTFPRIYFNGGGDSDKILSIENWRTIVWESMNNAFSSCSNLTYNAADAPNLSNVTSMYDMFYEASAYATTKGLILSILCPAL